MEIDLTLQPTFSIRDGKVTVSGDWPEEWLIPRWLVVQSDPSFLRIDGDRLHIEVENGSATYLMGEPDPMRGGWPLTRLYGHKR
jgi:hypothetical protein